MRLSAIELDRGCWKITRPSALTLKLAQFRMARSLVWLMVSVSAVAEAVALPDVTQVVGSPAPQLPATQTTGSSAACSGDADNAAISSVALTACASETLLTRVSFFMMELERGRLGRRSTRKPGR